jgi:hypothetical protein
MKEYKFNKRMFSKYMAKDKEIIQASSEFNNLPQLVSPTKRTRGRGRHLQRGGGNTATPESASQTDSPVPKKRMIISLDFTTSEEDDDEDERTLFDDEDE